jgi:hypothetical protein
MAFANVKLVFFLSTRSLLASGALDSGASVREDVQVQVLFRALWGRDFRDPFLLLYDYREQTSERM